MFIMENPIEMDDMGVPPFIETPCLVSIPGFIIFIVPHIFRLPSSHESYAPGVFPSHEIGWKVGWKRFSYCDFHHNSQEISWYNQYRIYVYINQSTTVSFNGKPVAGSPTTIIWRSVLSSSYPHVGWFLFGDMIRMQPMYGLGYPH